MALVNRWDRSRGMALVEAALVLPLLLMLTFGVMEYGWLFYKQQEISNATRQAARVAARADAKSADVEATITNLMTKAGLAGKYTVTKDDPAGVAAGNSLHVKILVPYSNVKLLGLSMIPVPSALGADVYMAKEGPG